MFITLMINMNPLTHFLFAYFLSDVLIGNSDQYLPVLFVSSTFIDLDHIFYLFKNFREVLRTRRFGSGGRTRIHELYGLSLFSMVLSVIYLVYPKILVRFFIVGVMSHYFLDFISGYFRPFYPFSGTEVFLGVIPDDFRVHVEVLITIILGGYFWLTL